MKKPIIYKSYIITRQTQVENDLCDTNIDISQTIERLSSIDKFNLYNKTYQLSNKYKLLSEDNIEKAYLIKFLGGVLDEPASYIDTDTLETRENDRGSNEAEKRGFYILLIQLNENEIEVYCESRNNILTFKSIIATLNNNQGFDGDHYDVSLDIEEDMELVLDSAQRLIEYTEVYDITGQGDSPVSADNTRAKTVEITLKSGRNNSMTKDAIKLKIQGRSENVTKTRIKLKDSHGETINYKLEEFQNRDPSPLIILMENLA